MLNLNNCYLVFALSIDMIGLCLSQYGYSFKENNDYSIYLNNTFNGLAPKMNGSLKKFLVNPNWFQRGLGVLSSPFQVSDERVNMMQG